MKTLIVADIHGQYEKLITVLNMAGFDPVVDRLIGLGDYIDYGPDSPKVLDYLCELRREKRHVFLAGNHELFISAMAVYKKDGYVDTWLSGGGDTTLEAYGWYPKAIRWIDNSFGRRSEKWYRDNHERAFRLDENGIAKFMKAVFPKKHLDLVTGLEDRYQLNEYVFSHDVLNESGKKNRVNIHAHEHSGLQVTYRRINIAAKHGEVGCLALNDLNWYSSDGGYLKVDRERLWSPGIDKSLEDV